MALVRKLFRRNRQIKELKKPVDTCCKDTLRRYDYELLGSVGKGAFGLVYKAKMLSSGLTVAVKIVERQPNDAGSAETLRNELSLLMSLKHPLIIRLHTAIYFANKYYMVMEYAERGDLCSFLKERSNVSENTKQMIFKQVAKALEFCHQQNIAHRDLKLENVLVQKNMDIKLADFGLAIRCASKTAKSKSFCGTMPYLAPEIASCVAYRPMQADIWSLGVLLYVMSFGYYPFPAPSISVLRKSQISGKIQKQLLSNCAGPSSCCRRLIGDMLQLTASSRPSAAVVVNHQWSN